MEVEPRTQILLQAIWDLTVSHEAWPSFRLLDRQLWRNHKLEASALIAETGPTLVLGGQRQGSASPYPDGEVALTVVGLAHCEGSTPVLEAVIRALRASVLREDTATTDSEIFIWADTAIPGASDGTSRAKTPRAASLARLTGLVLSKEPWQSQISLQEDGWRLTVDSRIRVYREIKSVSAYLAAREREFSSATSPIASLLTSQQADHVEQSHEYVPDEGQVSDVRQRDVVPSAEQPNRRQSTRAIAWTAIITTLISAPLGAILTHGLARVLDAYNTARAGESANVLDYVQPDGLTGDGVVGVVEDQLEVSGKLIQPLPRGRVLYTASRIASAGTGPRINDGPVGYGVLPCNVDEVAMTFACDRRPLGIAEDSGKNFYVWLIMPNASQLRDVISRSNAQRETNQLQDPPGPVWVSPTYVILRK